MSSSAIRPHRDGRKDSESIYSQSVSPAAITITQPGKSGRSKRGGVNDPVINVRLSDNYVQQTSMQNGTVSFAMPTHRSRSKKTNPESRYYDEGGNDDYEQSDEEYSHESDFHP